MKKQEKIKINNITEQCINSFYSWDKTSTRVFQILEQMNGLKKAEWELYKLPENIKEKVEENLKNRLHEELASLSKEIGILESLSQQLEESKSSHLPYCSEISITNDKNINCFMILNEMNSCLLLIIGMKKFPMRRISVSHKDSFKFLKDSNASVTKVIEQFVGIAETWIFS